MSRLTPILAALVLAAGSAAAGAALARPHGHHGERGAPERRESREAPGGRDAWRGPPRPPPGRAVGRGGYLPPQARGRAIYDYGRYRLRPPPRGYVWTRIGGGYALVSTATGQVFDVVPD